ncbi:TBC1 domain family member [Trichinella spiralis]|uniref:TBC1 domain family member n=1 Tax=Trichinella spiralis TaxID=6334 RepID=A0ABR3KNP2_TRISP
MKITTKINAERLFSESAPSSPRFKMLDLTEILSDGVLVKDCFTGVLVRRMKVKTIYGKFLADHRDLNSESRKIDCETANAIQKRSLSQLCLIYGYWSAQSDCFEMLMNLLPCDTGNQIMLKKESSAEERFTNENSETVDQTAESSRRLSFLFQRAMNDNGNASWLKDIQRANESCQISESFLNATDINSENSERFENDTSLCSEVPLSTQYDKVDTESNRRQSEFNRTTRRLSDRFQQALTNKRHMVSGNVSKLPTIIDADEAACKSYDDSNLETSFQSCNVTTRSSAVGVEEEKKENSMKNEVPHSEHPFSEIDEKSTETDITLTAFEYDKLADFEFTAVRDDQESSEKDAVSSLEVPGNLQKEFSHFETVKEEDCTFSLKNEAIDDKSESMAGKPEKRFQRSRLSQMFVVAVNSQPPLISQFSKSLLKCEDTKENVNEKTEMEEDKDVAAVQHFGNHSSSMANRNEILNNSSLRHKDVNTCLQPHHQTQIPRSCLSNVFHSTANSHSSEDDSPFCRFVPAVDNKIKKSVANVDVKSQKSTSKNIPRDQNRPFVSKEQNHEYKAGRRDTVHFGYATTKMNSFLFEPPKATAVLCNENKQPSTPVNYGKDNKVHRKLFDQAPTQCNSRDCKSNFKKNNLEQNSRRFTINNISALTIADDEKYPAISNANEANKLGNSSSTTNNLFMNKPRSFFIRPNKLENLNESIKITDTNLNNRRQSFRPATNATVAQRRHSLLPRLKKDRATLQNGKNFK